MHLFLLFILNSFFTYALIKILKPFLSKFFLDTPGDRSSHSLPIPSGAGISFVIASVISSFILKWYLPLICFPLALIGFIDDKYNLPRFTRYGFQIFTAILLINFYAKTNSNLLFLFQANILNLFYLFILIIGITTIINFSNFMDGLDGLLASSYFTAFLFLTIFYDQNLIFLPAALCSFLIFNWYPAKVFMGDVGSTYLGALYAGFLISEGDLVQITTKLLIISPLLMDSFFTLIRRLINRQNIFSPHKLHVYQRLSQSGMSDSKISLIYAFGVLVLCLVSNFNNLFLLSFFVFLEFCIGLYLSSIAKSF